MIYLHLKRFALTKYVTVVASLLLIHLTVATAAYENSENQTSPIATNLSAFASITPEWVFVDTFLKSSPWMPCDVNIPLETDANDWITNIPDGQCAFSFINWQMNGHYPAGEYVLLWEGDGTFEVEGDASYFHLQGQSEPTSGGIKRQTFDVTPSNEGLLFAIISVADDHLRNVRMIMPGGVCGTDAHNLNYTSFCQTPRGGEGSCSADESCFDFEEVYWDRFSDPVSAMNNPRVVFHPTYLDRLAKYRAIRFMQWTSTNSSTLEHWRDRAGLQKQTFADDAEYDDNKTKTTRGMPYEMAIALGNVLNADIYVNIPARATDDFNTQFAQLVADHLDPDLKVYIEYSNEVWNPGVDYALDGQYMKDQANLLGITGGSTDYVEDGYQLARFYSMRSVEIFDRWTSVFGAQANRVVRVLGAWIPDVTYTREILDWNNASQYADALAISGYVTGEIGAPAHEAVVSMWAAFNDLDAYFNEVMNGSEIGPESGIGETNRGYMAAHDLAASRGLRTIVYEGGLGIEAHKFSPATQDDIQQWNKNAHYDPRMREAMIVNFMNFQNANGAEFFHYNNADVGQVYGALEHQTQPRNEAIKYDAILDFIENTPCWWNGCVK